MKLNRKKGLDKVMHNVSNQLLIEAYLNARKLDLDNEFIQILKNEIKKRIFAKNDLNLLNQMKETLVKI